ncbi:hypothetical protein TeGR_g11505, partial [Tetraparma gracilis]
YSEVMVKVVEKVRLDAERDIEKERGVVDGWDREKDGKKSKTLKAAEQVVNDVMAAQAIVELIDRKVVKQTVMTSVYGVTFIGARQQLQARLTEKFEEAGFNISDEDTEDLIYKSSKYLTTQVMAALNDLFTGARATMEWLTQVAAIVSSQSQPVTWVTPLNLPCVQPYRRNRERIVNTVVQQVVISDDQSDLPIQTQKQRSAFPPNFVHSLDSSHMLMTAVEMKKRGLDFSAVHDSYWCHPRNVDEMSEILREQFVDLYTKPVLDNLRNDLMLQYPGIEFPPVPETGDLDLNSIKESRYFFQ